MNEKKAFAKRMIDDDIGFDLIPSFLSVIPVLRVFLASLLGVLLGVYLECWLLKDNF
uniref:Uncharacterized protein n=1 Tax=Tetranychus urticae TaxID=32264 RepID=T1JW78_TETUR